MRMEVDFLAHMPNPESTFEHLLGEMKGTQAEATEVYGWALRNMNLGLSVDFARMNAAILARWPKGLSRVKEAAHRWYRKRFGEDPIQ